MVRPEAPAAHGPRAVRAGRLAALTRRRAGLLLPVAALPGPYGVGDLGAGARDLVGWLSRAGQGVWQILPLNVVDGHGCPYASPTAFAREPLYLALDDLVDEGLLAASELPERRPVGPVDWVGLQEERAPLLHTIGERIAARVDLAPFVARHPWVLPWATFCDLRATHGPFWPDWPEAARDLPLHPDALRAHQEARWTALLAHVGLQWALDRQWARVRHLARAFDIELWGDLPFFVGVDSADVWSRRDLFAVDPDGTVRQQTGVPPDAFAADGQLWGHPQLDMEAQARDGWTWWRQRVEVARESVDVLRIDHFRGLEAVWSVPAGAATAKDGRWIPGPGAGPLAELVASGARLVAEDLGIITPEVRALRDGAGLPGMAVLQFAFGPGGEDHFLPHAHQPHQVVYTGTHDNDTLVGWLDASPGAREHLRVYLGEPRDGFAAGVRRAAWRSVATTAILPVQDVLGLGPEARTNVPGTIDGNWSWRCPPDALDADLAGRLAFEAIVSGRKGAHP
ncbi:MAG: 4-alpha-glucanotransferase [Alphaproteobacteria bacterium]|nr:4-alpha-glucanotransferase [Alphaproteobacteria bacterium]MCB9690801.1 4-alpha-glucanotransferase [Alphaproteobacteria bacterium]